MVEWLFIAYYYYAESASAEFIHPYTWKCMVPARDHRGGPPKKATCYASVEAVQKILLLMLPIVGEFEVP